MTGKIEAGGLAHIGIPTENLAESKAFFEQMGFEVQEEEVQPNGLLVLFLDNGGVVLELYEGKSASMVGAIEHIALWVEDIEAVLEAVRVQGYEAEEGGICSIPFSTREVYYFTVKGPGMVKVEFCQTAAGKEV